MAKRIESPSSINTFKQCQRKYYHQYIEQLPTLPNIHQIRGNIAHATLDRFYELDISKFPQDNYEPSFKTAIQQLFLHNWNQDYPRLHELKLSKDQLRFYFEETMLMLMNWTNHFLQDLRKKNDNGTSLMEAFQQLTPVRE